MNVELPEFLSASKLASEIRVSPSRVRCALLSEEITPDGFVTGSELRGPQPLFKRDKLDVFRSALLHRPVVIA